MNKPTVKVSTPGSRSQAAIKAWVRRQSPQYRAARSEKESKAALSTWCRNNGWKETFFEGPTGSPRNGIVDAVITRIKPGSPDLIEVRLVQLKSGVGRSEEHTSELQSHVNLVCRLLLEKKNNKRIRVI